MEKEQNLKLAFKAWHKRHVDLSKKENVKLSKLKFYVDFEKDHIVICPGQELYFDHKIMYYVPFNCFEEELQIIEKHEETTKEFEQNIKTLNKIKKKYSDEDGDITIGHITDHYGTKLEPKYVLKSLDDMSTKGILQVIRALPEIESLEKDKIDLIYAFEMQRKDKS